MDNAERAREISDGVHWLGCRRVETGGCGCPDCVCDCGVAQDLAALLDAVAREAEARALAWPKDGDKPLPEDDAIDAAFPTRSGRHDLYAEAMRMVGAKRSKGGLVALVTWLLLRIDAAEARGRAAAADEVERRAEKWKRDADGCSDRAAMLQTVALVVSGALTEAASALRGEHGKAVR